MATGGRKMAGDIVERTFLAAGGEHLFDDDYSISSQSFSDPDSDYIPSSTDDDSSNESDY